LGPPLWKEALLVKSVDLTALLALGPSVSSESGKSEGLGANCAIFLVAHCDVGRTFFVVGCVPG
jgi:hypothetical protein